MNTTFSGEIRKNPETDNRPEALSDEFLIWQWVVDGYLAEDMVVYAETANRVLEEIHRRHVDETDFKLSADAIERYTLLAGRSHAVNTVRLETIGEQPAVAEVAIVTGEVQVDSPLVSNIRRYLSTGDNLSEEDWTEVELPTNRDEIVAVCEELYATDIDPGSLTRLRLVADTVRLTLQKKEAVQVAHIKEGNMRGSRAKR